MQDFEKLGVFYLGRPYDPSNRPPKPGWVLYDAKDLVTHAVCVGMTGSGKTGLCISLLEEAAIDGIPALVIDPKGDLGNLLLTFPELRGEDFRPWVNTEDAHNQGLTQEAYAHQQASMWKTGLAEWGQDGERITKLRNSADFAIYTPGSTAGIPVSVLKSFSPPPPALLQDKELLSEQINSTVTNLLSLVGLDVDPLQSREHILLATILENAWEQGEDLFLAHLIQRIQSPPVTRIGILDIESFFPSKDRFALAMRLNNLLGAPGFSVWFEGRSLNIDEILYTSTGKPRIAIFSIAHLNDAERMFFVTVLLNRTIAWMRSQTGTTSLRALLYMDEVFGFFPPVKNPPSKAPLLTMLKQARAFGVGVVLATQNPVDLDYKGLGNAGTWFIGRLQTERDMARVLDGLEGTSTESGQGFDRQRMQRIIASLGKRVFLLHNVHEDAPEVFETRWTLSYLRGPLTRHQIKTLMDPYKRNIENADIGLLGVPPNSDQSSRHSTPTQATHHPPVFPPDVPNYFIPIRESQPEGAELVYYPMLLTSGTVHFIQAKTHVDVQRPVCMLTPMTDQAIPVDWDNGYMEDLAIADLETIPSMQGRYVPLPKQATQAKSYTAWKKDGSQWLYKNQTLDLWISPTLHLTSRPGESERDFRVRLQQAAHEQRDQETERLRKKYAPKITTITERIRRAGQAVERETEQATQQKWQAAISFGATLLGAFMGRKTVSTATVGRAMTAARGIGRTIKEVKDISRAEDTMEALQQQLADLEAQFQKEADALGTQGDSQGESLESISIRPKKSDVALELVALAWTPHWIFPDGKSIPAWK